MSSKPIDAQCPLRAVSADQFSKLFWALDESDRYYHNPMMVHHAMVAIWNWDDGCWWYSEVISVLADATRRGMEQLEKSGMKAAG